MVAFASNELHCIVEVRRFLSRVRCKLGIDTDLDLVSALAAIRVVLGLSSRTKRAARLVILTDLLVLVRGIVRSI